MLLSLVGRAVGFPPLQANRLDPRMLCTCAITSPTPSMQLAPCFRPAPDRPRVPSPDISPGRRQL